MPELESNIENAAEYDSGTTIAMLAEGMFLLNLLLPPVLWFVMLALLYLRHRKHESRLARNHLRQAFTAAGISTLLFLPIVLIVLNEGFKSVAMLIATEVYLVAVVTSFSIIGVFGLIKAMAQQEYRYPLIGKYLIEEE